MSQDAATFPAPNGSVPADWQESCLTVDRVTTLHRPVSLSSERSVPVSDVVRLALETNATGVDAALHLAGRLGTMVGERSADATRDTWELLATLAAADLGVARVVEPHLDALAILRQAGRDADPAEGRWGVFAAEGGDDPLRATPIGRGWTLSGTKLWCSLAGVLDRALVTAQLPDGRGLFAVDLADPGVRVTSQQWVARGLAEIPSVPVEFRDVPAQMVGAPGWYLSRPGFAWGGIGVAACWHGGAVGIARAVYEHVGAAPEPLLAMHLGAIDELVESSRRALAEAAGIVESGLPVDGSVLAKRVRATVARAGEEILLRAGHALGPAPLALDDAYAKRLADLQMYVRQHHAERDLASLGSALARRGTSPW